MPTLVGVDNTGALISQCGTEARDIKKTQALKVSGTVEPEARSISAGGSTVFFTARPLVAGMRWPGLGPVGQPALCACR